MWSTAFDSNEEGSAAATTPLLDSKTVSCLGWNLNFIEPTLVKQRTGVQPQPNGSNPTEPSIDGWNKEPIHLALDDFLDRIPDKQRMTIDPQLPDRLATLDIERVLPKLGVPPPIAPDPTQTSHGPRTGLKEAFSSQISLDAIFHSNPIEDLNAVSTLMSCFADGEIRPIMYDAMNIGHLRMPFSTGTSSCRAELVISHPFTCTHMLLVKSTYDGRRNPSEVVNGSSRLSDPPTGGPSNVLALVPLNLSSVRSAGTAMQLIASKATQLQNLFYYIEDVGEIAGQLFQEMRRFPRNRVEMLDSQLDEDGYGTSMELIYQLAATGYCRDVLKDWLVDTVADRVSRSGDRCADNDLLV